MLLIGIVGGVASGKSAVAACFAGLGAEVLDADRTGHAVLREPEVMEAIRHRWGERVFAADGQVDRAAVAAIVFAKDGGTEKKFLEHLSHPRIGELLLDRVAALRKQGAPAAVLDAALLFEAGWNAICNRIVFVDVPRTVRLDRALGRGWTAADFRAREARQWPVREKQRWADFTIDNSGSPERTAEQARAVWSQLFPAAAI
jgi:dephospho-CoA kinase